METPRDIYDPLVVRDIFDKCSSAYRIWSQVASFGFVTVWRRQCIDSMPAIAAHDAKGLDLMAGTGEAWPHLLKRRPGIAKIAAVDISSEMNKRALDRLHRTRAAKIELIEANVLENAIPDASADFIVSTFGLKTFNAVQHRQLAREIARILKTGGVFGLIEASDPKGWMLRLLYRFYLEQVLPLVERTVLNGAQDFSMISIYTKNFCDCRFFAQCLQEEGLEAEYKSFFFGCASGVFGRKK